MEYRTFHIHVTLLHLVFLSAACLDSSEPAHDLDANEDTIAEVYDPDHEDLFIDEPDPGGTCTTPLCHADSPCSADSVCVSADTRLLCNRVSCAAWCGTPCCSGSGCSNGASETCPEGTTCHQLFDGCSRWFLSVTNGARCLPAGTVEQDGQTWIEPVYYCSDCT